MESKYIEFMLIEKKPKTDVFAIISKSHLDQLGIIKWYAPWRQYCFFPEEQTIWNTNCMQDVKEFIRILMAKRRSAKSDKCGNCDNFKTGVCSVGQDLSDVIAVSPMDWCEKHTRSNNSDKLRRS